MLCCVAYKTHISSHVILIGHDTCVESCPIDMTQHIWICSLIMIITCLHIYLISSFRSLLWLLWSSSGPLPLCNKYTHMGHPVVNKTIGLLWYFKLRFYNFFPSSDLKTILLPILGNTEIYESSFDFFPSQVQSGEKPN